MKKTLLLLLLGACTLCQSVDATVPLRRVFSYRQSDGTTLMVQKEGNGHFVFYSTNDGMTLVRNDRGDFEYAVTTPDGLCSSGIQAHEPEHRTAMELSVVKLPVQKAYGWLSRRSYIDTKSGRAMTRSYDDGLIPYGQTAAGTVKSIGEPVIPILMVEFPDRKFMEETTPEKLTRMFNKEGYAEEKNCRGSVRDYFISQSQGLFKPSYEIVGKVKLSKSYAYYGKNYPNNSAIDMNVLEFVREALDSATVAGIDFSKYATDKGRVPLVSFFYAGPGEHSSFEEGSDEYLWAHFRRRGFQAGSTSINSYFVGNEVFQYYKADENGDPVVRSQQLDGIGVFVHEFGHALGLPDFYQTANVDANLVTPGYWSVMDYGQFCFDGYAPIGYSAFERASLGWLELEELNSEKEAKLYPFDSQEGPTAYIVRNDSNRNEYFLLENRQPSKWYPSRMGHGMLISHVDYKQSAWDYNEVNNTVNHQRYEIVPADNVKSAYPDGSNRISWDCIQADLFPGLNNVVDFTDDTTPASKVYTGNRLEKPIYNIVEGENCISFNFMKKNETGIEQLPSSPSNGPVEIYSLTGHRLPSGVKLNSGVYLIKQGSSVRKVYIR